MYRNVAPPGAPHSNSNQKGFASNSNSAPSKYKSTRDYFDDDDDDNANYQDNSHLNNQIDDEEVDPLDAFMSGVEQQIKTEASLPKKQQQQLPEIVSAADKYSDEIEEGYHQRTIGGSDSESDEEVNEGPTNKYDYNSDGELVPRNTSKTKIEPLPAIDHKSITYRPFKKCVYSEHTDVSSMSDADVSSLRRSLEVSVTGSAVPNPIQNFTQAGFHRDLQLEISKRGFERPTAIQAQCIPAALSGRDIIALAKTGSGKTFAFIWPMIMHVVEQPQMKAGDGPIGIILAPTRELATQIHSEASKFAKVYNIRIAAVYGGAGKYEMQKALQEWPEIVVATPGRFIELLRLKASNLSNCTMLVLDEADRMFEMGFHYQMRSIVNNIRPDRQTLLFSATMKKKVETFAREILHNPIRIVVGTIGQANTDIRQVVEVVADPKSKWQWLSQNLDEFVADGKVLIFVSTIIDTEDVCKELNRHFMQRQLDIQIDSIHGDKDQSERTSIIKRFSRKDGTSVLVATDVASRGLDIKDIRTVINYTLPKNVETYVHRIGRTGRMGVDGVTPGTAYTLLTPIDTSFAVDLVRNLQLSTQFVPPSLQRLAEQDPKWSQLKYAGGGGRGETSSDGGRSKAALGVGFGGAAAPKAMTSAHLAAVYSGSVGASSSIGKSIHDSAGSHYSTPSAVPVSVPASTGARPPGSVSRFSHAPVLPGFVRAEANYTRINPTTSSLVGATNVTTSGESSNCRKVDGEVDVSRRKKSRWDT